jgi:TIR domain
MSTVFVSYRRLTAPGEARALFNALVARLGKSAVFMDVDSISLGRDFRRELHKTLEACDLMLVVIDKDWAAAKDESGRVRLEDAGDYVRMEIEAALKRDIVVTPVLVRGARMPAAKELPAEIRDLAYRNAFELSVNRWESDVQELIRRLQGDGGRLRARIVRIGLLAFAAIFALLSMAAFSNNSSGAGIFMMAVSVVCVVIYFRTRRRKPADD